MSYRASSSLCPTKHGATSAPGAWHSVRGTLAAGLVLGFALGCQPATKAPAALERTTVRVAAASDLKFALPEIIESFEELHPGTHIEPTFGSSGNFYSQLSNRAPFDLFLSADVEFPRKLGAAGLADPASEFVYAIGRLVLWAPKSSAVDPESGGMQALMDPAVKKIAIANPAHAPYGRAAQAALKSLGLYDQVQDRLVLGDTVAQAAQFVESGAADVGLVAQSLAMAPPLRDKGRSIPVPADSYAPLVQAGIVLTWAVDRDGADEFRAFLVSGPAQQILSRHGFELPERP